jgi:hypothetical protein
MLRTLKYKLFKFAVGLIIDDLFGRKFGAWQTRSWMFNEVNSLLVSAADRKHGRTGKNKWHNFTKTKD